MAETKPLESRLLSIGEGIEKCWPMRPWEIADAIRPVLQAAERETLERAAQIVKEMAGEIGLHVAYHIEEMYPNAVKAAPKSFLLSVRNCTANKIAALGCDLGKG